MINVSYTHYTLSERECLAQMLSQGLRPIEIARRTNRSRSSVSREIKRNSDSNGVYNPWFAQRQSTNRRRQSYKCKLQKHKNKAMYDYVQSKLKLYWPPEAISAVWTRDNPQSPISFTTIYRSIKHGLLADITPQTHLRRKGKRKYARGVTATIKPEKTIHQRPDEANARTRIGDWEGDTMYGGIGKGLLVTNVCRKSRFVTAAIAADKRAATVSKSIVKALRGKPTHSITLDNGSEFADFRTFQKKLNTQTYFADPHSPWQRGSSENMNGLLRFFFPKGYNFKTLSQAKLNKILNLINERPRKCLGWRTPREVLLLQFT